jgi:hypothetical protein
VRVNLDLLAPTIAVAGAASDPSGETVTGWILPEFSAPSPNMNLWHTVFPVDLSILQLPGRRM